MYKNFALVFLVFSCSFLSGFGAIRGSSGLDVCEAEFDTNSDCKYLAKDSIRVHEDNGSPLTLDVGDVDSNSITSDIIESSSFSYTSNIDYLNFQADPITSTTGSIGVFRFDIRDGGNLADSDNLTTILTDITFEVTNIDNIRSAALFDGNALISNNVLISANQISFSAFSYSAPDDNFSTLTLRISFENLVADNQQLQFNVVDANADPTGSVFGTNDAGGAVSSILNNRNRIEVVADRLNFMMQPGDTNQNFSMSPPVEVSGTDINLNIDLDWSGTVSLSSSGIMTGDPIGESTVMGTGTSIFNTIIHTLSGTSFNLSASASGLIGAVSDSFSILTFNFITGDFRPLSPTDLSSNGQWQYFDGSSWVAVPDNNAPQNTSVPVTRILIDEIVTGGGSASKTYNCDILILNGGQLIINDDDMPPVTSEFLSAGNSIEVLSGGELIIRGDIDLPSSANLIVRNGGKMLIDQNSMTNDHPIWEGIEKFEGGSIFEINDWNWGTSPTGRSLVNVDNAISNNDNGYKFGNVYFNPTNLTDTWTIVGGDLNINISENDFEINNTSNNYVLGMSNGSSGISTTFGANLIVSDGPFTLGGSFSNGSFDQEFVIKGDLIVDNDDDFYLHRAFSGTPIIADATGNITIEGNLRVWGLTNIMTSDLDSKKIIFDGDTAHTIEIAPDCSNVPLLISSGDSASLFNEHLKFVGSSSLEIESGASFNFSFDSGGTGSVPLEIQNISGGSNEFVQNSGAYLYITHPQGIWDSSPNGNVQGFAASNTNYTQTSATYHYIGKSNQETGDAFSPGSTSKTLIVDLFNNSNELILTETTGTSAELDIRSGVLVITETNQLIGSGDLSISNGGLKTAVTSNTVPQLTGTYDLIGGFIDLNAANDQVFRGSRAYRDLFFSNAGIKTITSAVSNIDGTLTIQNSAILNVENKTMGGNNTNLTMTDNAQYITAGTGVKPDAQEVYNLGVGTKVTFTNNESSLQLIRLNDPIQDTPYFNIDVEGSSVGTNSLTTSVRVAGTFAVKPAGKFSFINTTGFSNSTDTAIEGSPVISLESGSFVEYAGDNQILTNLPSAYANIIISGTGTKQFGSDNGINISEDLDIVSSDVIVDNNKYIEVGQNTVVRGSTGALGFLRVETNGAFVQRGDVGTFTLQGLGSALINKLTAPKAEWLNYTYWSSPITTADISYSSSLFDPGVPENRRYLFNASNFLDEYQETNNDNDSSTLGQDDIDDNGDDWQLATGLMQSGRGYAVTGSTTAIGFPYVQSVDFSGTFNTGEISVPIEVNGFALDNDWNFIGNPYPSAIDFKEFYDQNLTLIEGVAYLWSQTNALSETNNGNDAFNFNQNDYAVISRFSGNTAGSNAIIPSDFIPSGQGFFVIGSSNGNVTFDNSIRMADENSNDQFFRLENANEHNKLWINLTSDNGIFNQILIAYVDGATSDFDGYAYDAPRNMAPLISAIIYTKIDSQGDKRFAIQGKSPLALDGSEIIPIGFHCNITEPTIYSFSIGQLQGDFMNLSPIYLKDNFMNSYQDLTQANYAFTSQTGTFDDRFEIVFTEPTALSVGHSQPSEIDLSIMELNDGNFKFGVGKGLKFKNIEIIDNLGRPLGFFPSKNSTEIINLTNISQSVFIAKIQLSNNQILIRKLVKRK